MNEEIIKEGNDFYVKREDNMNNIKEHIRDSGLRQKFICEKLGITESQLSHVICGRRKPNQKLIKSLSRILKVSVKALWPQARQSHTWVL